METLTFADRSGVENEGKGEISGICMFLVWSRGFLARQGEMG